MTASGFDSQVGYALESPSGTYTAPTRTLEHVSASLELQIDRIESKGIRATRRHQGRWYPGAQRVVGKIKHEASVANMALIVRQLMGAAGVSGAGPYTHTLTPGPLVETSTLTIQVIKPDEGGVNRVHSYLGCHLDGGTLTSKVGEIANIELDVFGQHLDVGQSAAAAAYPAAWAPFTFLHGTLSLFGSAYEFDEIQINWKNNLQTNRHVHRATTPARPKVSKESGWREWTGSLKSDYFDLTQLNRFIAGTEGALSLVFNAGASAQMTIAGNVRYDGKDPSIDGAQMTKFDLPFKFVSTTSDAAAMTVTIINGDAAI